MPLHCLQGASWLHVGTDQPFASVSIGGCCQVWAVARDGSAFYRGSVSPSKPAGECRLPCGGMGLSARLQCFHACRRLLMAPGCPFTQQARGESSLQTSCWAQPGS